MSDAKPLERYAVVVSRKWDNLEIGVGVTEEGIHVTMLLEEFLEALANELGAPHELPEIRAAAARIVAEMKDSTARVM